MADPASWVRVEVKGDVATLSLGREPVNSLNLDFWEQLQGALDRLEADPAVRGLIITTALRRDVFTAGNDLSELYAPRTSKERYDRFWEVSNVFLARLYRTPLATVAAIRGASPAGGCVMALCCDARVMTEVGTIGLNEVELGIPVPPYWARLMAKTVGEGPAQRLTARAALVSPQQALGLGLVDAVVTKADLMATAAAEMKALLRSPDQGRLATKAAFRSAFSQEWEDFCRGEGAAWWSTLEGEPVKKSLEAVFARLAGAKKKAKL